MSGNTNTLFWIIGGAAIVLSSFLLVNNTSDNTLNTVSNKFDSLWNEPNNILVEPLDNPLEDDTEEPEPYVEPEPPIEEEPEEEIPSNRFDEVSKKVVVNGLEVGFSGIRFLDEYGCYNISWYVKNISNTTLSSFSVTIDFVDVNTNQKIYSPWMYFAHLMNINKSQVVTGAYYGEFPDKYYAFVTVNG